jgi:hypothetical protein
MAANASARLAAMAKELRALPDKTVKTGFAAAMRAAAEPLALVVDHSAYEKLPKAGGLNERVANEKTSVSVLLGARTAAVRLKKTGHDARTTNDGYVRRPTFGHDPWVTQEIPEAKGWWDEPLKTAAPAVEPAMVAVMDAASAQLMAL